MQPKSLIRSVGILIANVLITRIAEKVVDVAWEFIAAHLRNVLLT